MEEIIGGSVMILSCQNIKKQFGETLVLNRCSFHIEEYEKAAVIGVNGAGKTTLLRIITGELPADDGIVTLSKGKTMGYLPQLVAFRSENTIYGELLSVKQHLIELEQTIRETELRMKQLSGSALDTLMETYASLTHQFEMENGYAYKSEVTGVLKGLGFQEDDFSKKITTLSGGQKTRVALGKLLLLKPDLILLDEPTNHLDMASISWLETYLLNYKGAVLIVSHDRYFLDRIATKIIEIDQSETAVFSGNYTDYAAKKELLRISKWNAWQNQQREIRHQEEVIEKLRSFNREKSVKRAESREKMLQKIEVLEKPTETKTDMKIRLVPRILSGNDVLSVTSLKKSFDNVTLFQNLNFSLKRGEHVAIIGSNGTGKTTILKIINNLLPADAGEIRTGTGVQIGYYDQEYHVLHPEKTLFEEISDAYPTLNNTEIRNTLAAFLFTGEEVFKLVRELSGGEKGRVSLAKLMLSEANFLILDEPTNHLDIMSKEILEDALNHYEGTVLYVSHDRYFINRTAHRILELSDTVLTNYLGNYDYYLEKKAEISPSSDAPSAASLSASSKAETEAKTDWKNQRIQQAKKRKLENDIKKTELSIETLELRNEELDGLMADPQYCTDAVRLTEFAKEKEDNLRELEALYEQWEALGEEMEE